MIDAACAGLNVVTVPLYDTQTEQDFEHVIELTNLKVLFGEIDKMPKYLNIITKHEIGVYMFDDGFAERFWLAEQELTFQV